MPETLANAVCDMLFSSNWTELVIINKNNWSLKKSKKNF